MLPWPAGGRRRGWRQRRAISLIVACRSSISWSSKPAGDALKGKRRGWRPSVSTDTLALRNDESPRRNGSIIAEHRWRGLLHLGTRSALIMRMRVVARRCRRVAHAKAARYPRIRVPHIHRVYPGPCIARVVPKAWPSRFLMRDPPVFGTSAETTSPGRSRARISPNDAPSSCLDCLCKQRRFGAARAELAGAPAGLAHSLGSQQPAWASASRAPQHTVTRAGS